jgi:hypothetical protein
MSNTRNNRNGYRTGPSAGRQSQGQSGKGHWKLWTGLVVAAVLYVNNGGDLGDIIPGGDGGGAPARAPVTNTNTGGGNSGDWMPPCTATSTAGC